MTNTVGGTVTWNLDVDTSKFNQGLKQARGGISGLTDEMKNASANIKRSVDTMDIWANRALATGTALSLGFASVVQAGVKNEASLESATKGFEALLGSAEKARVLMERIKREAIATPFSIEGLTSATQSMVAITKDGDLALDTILDIGKAIATAGKGQPEFDRVVANLQQVASTEVVTEIDVRQFSSAIPIFDDIIGSIGLTREELKKAENGSELLFKAFKKAGEKGGITAQGFTAHADTMNFKIARASDAWAVFTSTFVRSTGIFDKVATVFEKLAGVLETNGKFIGDLVLGIGGAGGLLFVFGGVIKAITTTIKLWGEFKGLISGARTALTIFASSGLAPVAVSFGTIVAVATAVWWILDDIFKLIKGETTKTEKLIRSIGTAFSWVSDQIEKAWNWFKKFLGINDTWRADVQNNPNNISNVIDKIRGGTQKSSSTQVLERLNMPMQTEAIKSKATDKKITINNNNVFNKETDPDAFTRKLAWQLGLVP